MKLTLPIETAGSTCAPVDVPIVKTATEPRTRSELLLVCEARSTTLTDGYWRFSLESADGAPVFEAEDCETGDLNRLTLLAAVRGLESIEGPSSITLVSNNRYLIRSLADSLPRWRRNDFIWEHFGRRIDVQHADLWRRVDRALQIHRVEACLVSTRLVSSGSEAVMSNAASINTANKIGGSGVVQQRIDQPGERRNVVPAPKSRALRGPKANRVGKSQTQAESSDRLRDWLLGGLGGSPQRRFTADDLLEQV